MERPARTTQENPMTKTFEVQSRATLIFQCAFAVGFGSLPALLAGTIESRWLLGLAISSDVWLAAWQYVRGRTLQVGVFNDGTVEFVRLWASVKVAAREIRVMKGAWHRDEDGDLFWDLRISHA